MHSAYLRTVLIELLSWHGYVLVPKIKTIENSDRHGMVVGSSPETTILRAKAAGTESGEWPNARSTFRFCRWVDRRHCGRRMAMGDG